MLDFGVSKLVLIGAVALVVIGPKNLPRVARDIGRWVGKAQRYVADVKAEVNRSMELDELKKMKETVEGAARDVENSIHTTGAELDKQFDKEWSQATGEPYLDGPLAEPPANFPEYKHPKKKWRIKQGSTPNWYKARHGVRSRALSGAARVARFRPVRLG